MCLELAGTQVCFCIGEEVMRTKLDKKVLANLGEQCYNLLIMDKQAHKV